MSLVTSTGRQLPPDGEPSQPEDRQRKRLILALVLFLAAIGVVIYKGSTSLGSSSGPVETSLPAPEAVQPSPAPAASDTTAPAATTETATAAAAPAENSLKPHEKLKTLPSTKNPPADAAAAGLAPTVTRKVLPPLAVEVFAGGRPVPLQTNPSVAVHVDTSNGVRGRAAVPGGETASGATSSSGRVHISAEALQVLSHPVDPNYPLLAREMKVQGSVILDALISRDGTIQALKIVSGPTILATAAMEAVRQWRFKPYLQAGQPVETEARITVNFTISTT